MCSNGISTICTSKCTCTCTWCIIYDILYRIVCILCVYIVYMYNYIHICMYVCIYIYIHIYTHDVAWRDMIWNEMRCVLPMATSWTIDWSEACLRGYFPKPYGSVRIVSSYMTSWHSDQQSRVHYECPRLASACVSTVVIVMLVTHGFAGLPAAWRGWCSHR